MDYRYWMQTMYCNFGEKWVKLHRGPMWCATRADQNFDKVSVQAKNHGSTKVFTIYIYLDCLFMYFCVYKHRR